MKRIFSLVAILFLAGCSTLDLTEVRNHPLGPPETVEGNYRVLAKTWDQEAPKITRRDGFAFTSLNIDQSAKTAEIMTKGPDGKPSGLIELKAIDDQHTRMTAYGSNNVSNRVVRGWMEMIRGHP